ncbi:MAG: hypothetical protein MZV63_08865 [Marinilabiliales bacterium]|nr:hypothetical protein [Marinilabiliales bacterium]
MVVSLLVYVIFNNLLPNKEKAAKGQLPVSKMEFKLMGAHLVLHWQWVLPHLHFHSLSITRMLSHIGLFAGFVAWILVSAKRDEYEQGIMH